MSVFAQYSGWKAEYMTSCQDEANKSASLKKAVDVKGYCDCTLQKLVEKYPKGELQGMPSNFIETEDGKALIAKCVADNSLANFWDAFEKEFIKSCKNSFNESAETAKTYNAQGYCTCMLNKIKTNYEMDEVMDPNFGSNPKMLKDAEACLLENKK